MAAVSSKIYDNEAIIKEISEVINESVGVRSYEVKRIVEVDDIASTTITLELIWNEKGKKVIV